MIFTYLKQPLNRYTFNAPKIRQWVEYQCKGKTVLNLFAGPTLLNGCTEIRNDLDPAMPALYHMDALELVKQLAQEGEKFDVVLLDPPYAYRKVMEMYKAAKDNVAVNETKQNSRFKRILDVVPEILADDGKVITFGYHSRSMSGKRGFKIKEICLISHGGAQHDTIATVEERINKVLLTIPNKTTDSSLPKQ
jgi:hypothetical protein